MVGMALTGCDAIPQDIGGTTEQIRAEGQVRVGIVAGTELPERATALVEDYAVRQDAATVVRRAPASELLDKLERGDVDLVLGRFGRTSPLAKEASFSAAIGEPEPKSGKVPVLRLARKHGENRLITETDRMIMR